MMEKGSHHSEKTCNKISDSLCGQKHSKESYKRQGEAIRGHKNPQYGKPSPFKCKHHTEEARKKQAIAKIGKPRTKESCRKQSITMTGEGNHMWGKHHTEETLNKQRIARIRRIKNDIEYREKIKEASIRGFIKYLEIAGIKYDPKIMNRSEEKLFETINKVSPGKYRFNPWDTMIGGKFPDFINIDGEKKCIDFFGEMWHDKDEEAMRISHLAKYGWRCLVIWGKELRTPNKVEEKIINFCLESNP